MISVRRPMALSRGSRANSGVPWANSGVPSLHPVVWIRPCMNRSQQTQCEMRTHGGLTARPQCDIVALASCEVDEWLQNELAVSFHVSFQCASCELKFFTGLCMHAWKWHNFKFNGVPKEETVVRKIQWGGLVSQIIFLDLLPSSFLSDLLVLITGEGDGWHLKN